MSPTEMLKSRPDMPWWVELLVAALLSGGTAIYLSASHDDRVLGERVSAVESTISAQKDIDRVRDAKTDHIQSQVDRLVEWALGKK